MIVTASLRGRVPDFEDLSFRCLAYNEVAIAVNSVGIPFRHADVAACVVFEDMMVPGCVEAAQKSKRLLDFEFASPWYGVSVHSRELLFGTYVTSLRAAEVSTRYTSALEYTSRYSEGLAREKRSSPTKTVAAPVTSSPRPQPQEDVVIGDPESDSGSSVVMGESQWKKPKWKVVNFAIGDCYTVELISCAGAENQFL